ncbi:HEXXH motif domain-containing protein, partial [Streptomyces sp. S6]
MTLSDAAITALGRTAADPATLHALVRDQHTRQLAVVRAVLETAGDEPSVREAWALLTQADRRLPTRDLLLHPLTGSWAWHTLRTLDSGDRRHLGHLAALAAACAVRAGLDFTSRLTAREGLLVLPSLGALRTDGDAEVTYGKGRLRIRATGEADVVVHPEPGVGAWSASPAWLPAHALPGLVDAAPLVPLEDLHPYRTARSPRTGAGLGEPVVLDDAGRKQWAQVWSGTAAALRAGGEERVGEAVALLRCLVPLDRPPGVPA